MDEVGRQGVNFINILRAAFTRAGLNFINVLRTAFTLTDPKSVKKTIKWSSMFTLLGSTIVKAARKTLVKLTPDHKRDKKDRGLDYIYLHFWNLCV
jgi:hypothetical protein